MVDIERVKEELKFHKVLLDNAFERNDYIAIEEQSESITKLAYLLTKQRVKE